MDPVFEFPIALPARDSRGLLRALHGQLRAAILDGRLKPGLRLPSTRRLADTYGLSRNTAVAAYDLLLSEGYVAARRGSGVYVASALPRRAESAPEPVDAVDERRLTPYWRNPPPTFVVPQQPPPKFDFALGIPDAAPFPFAIWRRLASRAVRAIAKTRAPYAPPRGQPALRESIAKHASFARAVACAADDIIVTSGAQQAFDLIARILVTPGRTIVAVEDPGYPPFRTAFAAHGAKIVPVRVDGEGLVVDEIPREARVVYVTPSHQFPLGSAMSARRRAALLDFAATSGAVVVEDDYDGEFRYGGRPLDALQTLDRAACVFYVGTFSKSLFPSIRLGYIVAPPWAQRALIAAKRDADWHSPVIEQDTLAAFIAEGHMARHVRRMRAVYAARREILLGHLTDAFGPWLEPIPSIAGLHLSAFASREADVPALIDAARRHEVGLFELRGLYFGKPARLGFAFGYGTIDERAITQACARLRKAWPGRMGG
ncbi:MAG TPA: PLP-dependent aminotransferase family protein [Rhodanobacteraceae bacterium]|nr:PLP-dependent aminotransferase family protein [Rhodanobacteraceae bacterium]